MHAPSTVLIHPNHYWFNIISLTIGTRHSALLGYWLYIENTCGFMMPLLLSESAATVQTKQSFFVADVQISLPRKYRNMRCTAKTDYAQDATHPCTAGQPLKLLCRIRPGDGTCGGLSLT